MLHIKKIGHKPGISVVARTAAVATMVAASVTLLASCAPALNPVPEDPIPLQTRPSVNTVCNHIFSQSQQASAPVFVETEDNLILEGNTSEELMTALLGTPNNGGGTTVWNLKWQFDSTSYARGCKIDNVQTRVTVTYQLPLWPESVFATNREFAEQWTRHGDALREHHCLHGKTAIDASIEVKESLKRMALRRSCDLLKEDADDLARSIVGKYKEVESRFTAPNLNDYFY